MKVFLSLLTLFVSSTLLPAQDFAIRGVEMAADNIIVYYELTDSVANHTYTVNLYSSMDDFITPLSKVSGDLGLEVKPGRNRKIIWNVKSELGSGFQGKVGLEIRGRIYIPFVRLDQLSEVYKRNKSNKITWVGGRGSSVLNFELYKGDKKITVFPNIANVGTFNFRMDNGVRPGKNYRFKITDTRNKDDQVYSSYFSVRRKVPLFVKIVPVVGAAAAAALVSKASSGDNFIGDPTPHP